ncbi:hypothetical protein MTO96_009864 [Rhipicephalus appendiculatus]
MPRRTLALLAAGIREACIHACRVRRVVFRFAFASRQTSLRRQLIRARARTDRSINTARRRHLLTQPAIGVQSGPARLRFPSRAAEHTRHYANFSLEVASTSVGLFVLRTGGIGGRASLSAADVVSNGIACSRV